MSRNSDIWSRIILPSIGNAHGGRRQEVPTERGNPESHKFWIRQKDRAGTGVSYSILATPLPMENCLPEDDRKGIVLGCSGNKSLDMCPPQVLQLLVDVERVK